MEPCDGLVTHPGSSLQSVIFLYTCSVICVMEQLRTGGPRHHLLSSVAPPFSYSSLLHQLFVHLLPPPAADAYDLLLREDPAGAASCVEAGELMAGITFNCIMSDTAFSSVRGCVCTCRSVGSTGSQRSGGKIMCL